MIADLLVNNWYGHITQNTTWGPGHYVITGDVTVDPGVKLTILPGTKIDFYPNVNNQIYPPPFRPSGIFVSSNGKLTAIGSDTLPIVFRSNASLRGGTPSNSDWNGIYLGDGSIDTLKFCQISDCCSGIRSVYAGIAVIDSNTISNCQTYGILVSNARNQTGGVKVRRNRILNPAPVYGIYVERTNTSTPTAWQIAYNYIEMGTYGIYVNADSIADNALTIYWDTLAYTGTAGGGATAGVHLEGTKKGVLIRRCRIVQGSGGTSGIQCANRVWPIIDSTKMVSTPDITGQQAAYGIYIDTPNASSGTNVTNVRRDSIGNFNTGVYVGNCSSNPPRLGINKDQTFWGENNIVGCMTWNVYYWGLNPPTMRAEANWWGSNPPDPNKFYPLALIDYNPYKTAPMSQPWVCSEPGGGGATQGAELLEALLPTKFDLSQSYPNPANGKLTIQYALPQEAHVSMKVYNVAGQLIRTLVSCPMAAGYHSVRWDGKSDNGHLAGPGVYFYRMDAGTFTSTKKLILAR